MCTIFLANSRLLLLLLSSFLCPDPSVTNVKEETALHTAMQSDGEDEDICKIVSRLLTDRYITRRCIIMGN